MPSPAKSKAKRNSDAPLAERWAAIRAIEPACYVDPTRRGPAEQAFDQVWDWVKAGAYGKSLDAVAADPSLALRNSPRGTLLSAAYMGKRHSLAIELIAKGAWGAIGPEAASAPFKGYLDALHASIAENMPDGASILAASRALESSGRPAPEPLDWVLLAWTKGRFDTAAEVADRAGVKPDARMWEAAADAGAGSGRRRIIPKMASYMSQTHSEQPLREGAWRLAELNPRAVPQDVSHALWRASILHGDAQSVDKLIGLGMAPEGWILPKPSVRAAGEPPHNPDPLSNEPCSILALAAASPYSSTFAALRRLPEAVQAAKDLAQSPMFLASCSIQTLSSLARLDADLGSVDKDGRNVLHHWAKQDGPSPRNGWTTMAKLRPELFEAKDRDGLTPEALQRSTLAPWPKKLAAFSALMAKSERSRICAELADAPPAQQASKPRL